jgi:hypothetical protein
MYVDIAHKLVWVIFALMVLAVFVSFFLGGKVLRMSSMSTLRLFAYIYFNRSMHGESAEVREIITKIRYLFYFSLSGMILCVLMYLLIPILT